MDVIIPFRDDLAKRRRAQLMQLLPRLAQVLPVNSQVYLATQHNDARSFNRGLMLNMGVKEALKQGRGDSIVLHDVDLLPSLAMAELYRADFAEPLHLAGQWMGRYDENQNYVGGVLALKKDHFVAANGLPNTYWGWGGEDEAFGWRLRKIGHPTRKPNRDPTIYYYDDLENLSLTEKLKLLKDQRLKCENKWELRNEWSKTWQRDGLNSATDCAGNVTVYSWKALCSLVAQKEISATQSNDECQTTLGATHHDRGNASPPNPEEHN
jgi:hypothetical protein